MEFTTLINWTVHFRLKGCWVICFMFIQVVLEYSVSKQWRPSARSAPSDLGLHCLLMSYYRRYAYMGYNFVSSFIYI